MPGPLNCVLLLAALLPINAFASAATEINLTTHWTGFASLAIFVFAYVLVICEDWLHLKKSIPVLMAAGMIWTLIAFAYSTSHVENHHLVDEALRHSFLEFAELFFFLLVAMTFINTLEERGVFEALQHALLSRGFSLRTVYWITGSLAFAISPIADNLTTALVMSSVVLAVGQGNSKFVLPACINIVVAANAAGSISPFGDVTTLMVWQKGVVETTGFLALLLPALVCWLIPAGIMSFTIPRGVPTTDEVFAGVKPGAYGVIVLFLATVFITIALHIWLHLPPVAGMMAGLGYLKLYGYFLGRGQDGRDNIESELIDSGGLLPDTAAQPKSRGFNIFQQVARAEWDTLLFFYGIILCVGGLAMIGYLSVAANLMYGTVGASVSNVLIGVFSAIVDNIPVMYAVLTMNPDMSQGHWLLAVLAACTGGSMLAIGSAAGVAVLGHTKGAYTFMGHLRWTWAIALGYAAGVAMHFWINADLFLK